MTAIDQGSTVRTAAQASAEVAAAVLSTERLFVVRTPDADRAADDCSSRADEPVWLPGAVNELAANVGDPGYPCHFGRQAMLAGDLFGTWLGRHDDEGLLTKALSGFLDTTRPYSRRRLVLACFFEPESDERTHEWYGDRFWHVLRRLHTSDDQGWPAQVPVSPTEATWEFCFHGTPIFVFSATPTHVLRRSRQLGRGMVLLFQPRNVFHGLEGGSSGGIAARMRIRTELDRWDLVGSHPVMGDYGDPTHPEWKQYFIADHDRTLYSHCPVSTAGPTTLHDLVVGQSRRTPDALAVVAGSRSLTYRQLDEASAHLAGELTRRGVRPEDRVGVMADRSADTVVTLLAVLRAGAAYVPIDPDYPEHRRAMLLDEAAVDVVVTPRHLAAAVPVGPRWLMVCDDRQDGTGAPAGPLPTVNPDNLAYVIYTSGSTGTPKGVAVEHRQVVHAITAEHEVERPWPEAFLLSISFSFDASGVGLYWTLSTGGCVVIPAEGEHKDPERLRELIARYGITHTDCSPSMYEVLLGGDVGELSSLTCAQVGGEVCPPDLVARHRALLPDCVFENNYGPTEATIWASTNVLDPTDAIPRQRVPIGFPIPGARVYLLDGQQAPVAQGDAGEIFVGGAGVTRGYLGRPAATAECFLPDPFSGRRGARMYRTGDLASLDEDGSLQFVGRRDGQVKVRGYRIELGEIEVALRRHPGVAEAVVDVRPIGGEPTLVGYVRTAVDRTLDELTLTSHLAGLLPEHMTPRRYVQIDRVPLTVSGKVDRTQLPDPRRVIGRAPRRRTTSAGVST